MPEQLTFRPQSSSGGTDDAPRPSPPPRRSRARTTTRLALLWIAFVAACGCLAPLLASGHPLRVQDRSTAPPVTSFPLFSSLTPLDIFLAAGVPALCIGWLVLRRAGGGGVRATLWLAAMGLAVGSACFGWTSIATRPPRPFTYEARIAAGSADAAYTLIPWSPTERLNDRNVRTLPPGSSSVSTLPPGGTAPAAPARPYHLGTDSLGQDVLSNLIHGCRVALMVGLVATLIALGIGVTTGSVMGSLGGWVDLFLGRVIEVFQGVPILFMLVLAAGVLPRSTLVMMAIIGCFTWTTAARFTRAEFLKLRELDYVAAARASGLPRWRIIFRHMLPNGVTPVLVEAGFMIAGAILVEATLSFLSLAPEDQPSWGRTLAMAAGESGEFHWWLAVFPGLTIFLTVLSYNVLGESVRERLDPRA